MLPRIKLAFIILVLIIITPTKLFSQSIYGPVKPNSYREISKVGTQALQSRLIPSDLYCIIGKNMVSGQQAYSRVVFQWDIPDNVVPDNSTITNVQLHFEYTKYNHSFELGAQFSSLSIDNTNPTQTQLDQMWYEMSNTTIGAVTGVNNVINFTSNNSQDPFNIAIRDALVNDRFVLGIIAPLPTYITDRIWNIKNPSVTLRIEYLPPTQQVTVDQKLPDNTSIDSVGLYNFSQTRFDKFSVPQTFLWDVGSSKTLQASQKIIDYNKYQKWLNEPDVINHRTFNIEPSTNFLTAQFNQTNDLIKIRNTLEGTTVDGGLVSFKDPWLIDYPDPLYGNTPRNRGMDASFKQRTSPFFPDYTTSYNGDVYKGVFLNQGINELGQWQPPYYSVKTDYQQDIFLNQTGRTHKFYFQGWSASPQGSAEFQNANLTETPVVFKQANATVQANLKGTQLSNNSSAYSKGSQRKFYC